MKSIRVIDPDFNLVTEIDDYESLLLTRRWHKRGGFELRININKQNTDALQNGNLIILQSETKEETHLELNDDLSSGVLNNLVIEG